MSERSTRVHLALLLGVALALRIAWALAVDVDPRREVQFDMTWYDLAANSIALGRGISNFDGTPTALWPPGYPALMAPLYAIFDADLRAPKIANAVLGALTCLVTFALGKRLFGPRVGLAAAWILALYPGHIFFSALILSELAFTLLMTLVVWLFAVWNEREPAVGPLHWVAFGALVGVACLFRGMALAYLVVPAAVWWLRERPRRTAVVRTSFALVGMLLAIAPWTLRNYIKLGSPVLIATSLGRSLGHAGHYPGASGTPTLADFRYRLNFENRFKDLKQPEREIETNRAWTRETLHYFFTHPGHELTLIPRRFVQLYKHGHIGLEWGRETLDSAKYKKPLLSAAADRRFARLADVAHFAVLGLALWGAVLALRSNAAAAWILPLSIAYTTTLHSVIFPGNPRYHMQVIPIFCLLAALGAGNLAARLRGRAAQAAAIAAALAIPACGSPAVPDLVIDLSAFPDYRDDAPRLDFYVRLPEAARVLARAPFRASVATESSIQAVVPVARDDAWQADLSAWAGQVVRLRLTATEPGAGGLAPRIEGRPRADSALLRRESERDRRYNVLLYVIDTLRADRLSAYGYERPTSPRMEQLAEESVRFERAYAPGPNTHPSMSSLFASRYASELSSRLAADGPAKVTLTEAFQQAGYATAGFQANFLLFEPLGYSRGFDHYQVMRRPVKKKQPVTAQTLHAAALAWLREPRDKPFFLYIQTMDVHNPYAPPPPWNDLFMDDDRETPEPDLDALRKKFPELVAASNEQIERLFAFLGSLDPNRYDGAIAYADDQLGQLLDALEELGVANDTVVVVTSDHGESLFERGQVTHGHSLYEELVRIPLFLRLPVTREARSVTEIVGLIDLGPTLLTLTGIPVPKAWAGQSWLLPRGEPHRALGERLDFETKAAIEWYLREDDWKYYESEEGRRLFDLARDPGETVDRSADQPLQAAYMASEVRRRSPAFSGATSPASIGSELSIQERRELEERLRALGYME